MIRPALAGVLAFAGAWLARPAGAAAQNGFEELARQAAPVTDLSPLVAPFVDDCRRSKGEFERTRCETVRGFLRAHLPARTFLFTREGEDAVLASPYDGRTRSVRVAVVGCLACKELVEVGPERRYVTIRPPTRGPSGGPVAAELARASVAMANVTDVDKWTATVQPRLRTELLFQPADDPWTVGQSRGYAFKLVGVRVYNRCTGEVLLSEPPSRAPGPKEDRCD